MRILAYFGPSTPPFPSAQVLVHPDKNPHPEATRAFQRVAQAWAVLSNPQKRRDYDQDLRRTANVYEI